MIRPVHADMFWQIIDDAREAASDAHDADEIAELTTGRLARLAAEQVLEFEVFRERLVDEANRWDLWAAAYLINGGCSDDGFDYFRGWLLAQGRAVWVAAVGHPDSLADVVDPAMGAFEIFCEDMLAAASTAFGRVTGNEDAFWDALPERADGGTTSEPSGEEFDFDDADQMRARLPRLAAAFLEAADAHPASEPEQSKPAGFLSRLRRKR